MIKVNSGVMNSVLIMLKKPDEEIQMPIYANIKRQKFFTTASTQFEYGFIASTNQYNLLVVQFDIFDNPQVTSYPLLCLRKAKITPFIAGTYMIKLIFEIEGKKKKIAFSAAKKVINTDLYDQEENLEGLIKLFERYTE